MVGRRLDLDLVLTRQALQEQDLIQRSRGGGGGGTEISSN